MAKGERPKDSRRLSRKKTKQEIFFDEVCRMTKLVPKNKLTTYGAIARAMGVDNYR